MSTTTPAVTTAADTIAALLRQGQTIRFTAAGNSMHPLIPSGSTLIVRPFLAQDARPGAILFFPHGRRLVLHRLVRIEKPTGVALFCGDMTQHGHETVALGQVLGTAIAVIRPDGKERALHTRPMRWRGLIRYYARPLRRAVSRLAARTRREAGRANRPGEPL